MLYILVGSAFDKLVDHKLKECCKSCFSIVLWVITPIIMWMDGDFLFGFLALSFGGILNETAALANGGLMPVKFEMLKEYDFDTPKIGDRHTVMHCYTRMKWLCDIFEFEGSFVSVGDMFILIGLYIVSIETFIKAAY
jgi:hypothetical protein